MIKFCAKKSHFFFLLISEVCTIASKQKRINKYCFLSIMIEDRKRIFIIVADDYSTSIPVLMNNQSRKQTSKSIVHNKPQSRSINNVESPQPLITVELNKIE